jgi:hypothetical protein
MTIDYAARARALVGTRFRPQGRSEDGLDCVGVVIATFGIAADQVRRDYRLRGNDPQELRDELDRHFRRVPKTQLRAGDVMVLVPGERQLHLAVRTPDGFVHADARIRRVVETPGEPHWPLIAIYRKRRSR